MITLPRRCVVKSHGAARVLTIKIILIIHLGKQWTGRLCLMGAWGKQNDTVCLRCVRPLLPAKFVSNCLPACMARNTSNLSVSLFAFVWIIIDTLQTPRSMQISSVMKIFEYQLKKSEWEAGLSKLVNNINCLSNSSEDPALAPSRICSEYFTIQQDVAPSLSHTVLLQE